MIFFDWLKQKLFGYDIPQIAIDPYYCIGCEQAALQVSGNSSNGIESIVLCQLCGCSIMSKNFKIRGKMLAKLDNGNAVLFSEIQAIGMVDQRSDQVVVVTKNENKYLGNKRVSEEATIERDRLIGEWEDWLKGDKNEQ